MKVTTVLLFAATALFAAPVHATAEPAIEGCHYSASADQWQYPNGSPCRGTGEDPTTDSAGRPVCANGATAQPSTAFGTRVYSCVGTWTPPEDIDA